MKWLAPLIAVTLIVIITASVGDGLLTQKKYDVHVATGSASALLIDKPNQAIYQKSIIPKGINPDEKPMVQDDDFTIVCDKTVYTFPKQENIFCNVTNNKNNVVINDIGLIFKPSKEDTQIINMWVLKDERWINVKELHPSENKAKGLKWKGNELKQFKLLIEVPLGSSGKFDVVAGSTILDPWWNTTWISYRDVSLTNSTENSCSDVIVEINATTGPMGNICGIRVLNSTDDLIPFGLEDDGDLILEVGENITFENSDYTNNAYIIYYNNNTPVPCANSSYPRRYRYYDGFEDGTVSPWTTTATSPNTNLSTISNPPINGSFSLNATKNGTASSFEIYSNVLTTSRPDYFRGLFNSTVSGSGIIDIFVPTTWFAGGPVPIIGITRIDSGILKVQDGVGFTDLTAIVDKNIYEIIYENVSWIDGTFDIRWRNLTDNLNGTLQNKQIRFYPTGTNITGIFLRNNNDNAKVLFDDFEFDYKCSLNVALSSEIDVTDPYIDTTDTTDIYEMELTTFTATVQSLQSNVETIYGSLIWNGTNTTYISKSNSTPQDWTFTQNITPGLSLTDNVTINSFWNFTIVYDNSTIIYNETSDIISQTLHWAYYWGTPTANPSTVLMGEDSQINSTLNKINEGATIISTVVNFNDEEYTPLQSGSEYYRNVNAPTVSSPTTVYYNFSMQISDGINTLQRNSSVGSMTVNPIDITDCSSGEAVAKFFIYDESNPYTKLNSTMDMTIWIWTGDRAANSSFNFSFTKNHSHTICLDPNSTVTSFSVQQFDNQDSANGQTYPAKNFYMLGQTLTNGTIIDYDLYLLNSTYADVVAVEVRNNYGQGLSNHYVVAQRYYPGENQYRTTSMIQTDSGGNGALRLEKSTDENNVFYRFIVYDSDFRLLQMYENLLIIDNLYTLPITDAANNWLDYDEDVQHSCLFNNNTQLLYCTYSGNLTQASLFVQEITSIGFEEKCDVSSQSSSGTLQCDLSGMTDETYQWFFDVIIEGATEATRLRQGHIHNLGGKPIYDQMGLWITFMMILMFAFIGYYSPEFSLVMSVVAVIGGALIGFYTISLGGVVSIVLAAALIIYKVRN